MIKKPVWKQRGKLSKVYRTREYVLYMRVLFLLHNVDSKMFRAHYLYYLV